MPGGEQLVHREGPRSPPDRPLGIPVTVLNPASPSGMNKGTSIWGELIDCVFEIVCAVFSEIFS